METKHKLGQNNEPTITELPKMLEEYEKRHDIQYMSMTMFTNGMGVISSSRHFGPIFEFESIPELIEKLKQ